MWKSQRKLASHEFSTRCLREFVVKVLEDEVEKKLVPLLEDAAENTVVLDLQQVLKGFAFDVICRVALGFDPAELECSSLANAFDEASMFSAMRGGAVVSAVWKLKRVVCVGSERRLKEAVMVVHGAVDEIIQLKKNKMRQNREESSEIDEIMQLKKNKIRQNYEENCGENSKTVDELIQVKENKMRQNQEENSQTIDEMIQQKKNKLRQICEKNLEENSETVDEMILVKKNKMKQNREENSEDNLLWRLLSAGNDDDLVRDMVISFLMAGRDTTSSAMTWLFWLISRNEAVENELLNEVRGDDLVFDSLKEMKYMKACICESMRLYPPVVWDSKHAANDDVLPDGTAVYKGDRVTYFPYGMGRMEELWGKDRLEFRPDRWFDESGGLKMVSPYKYPVFQAGPRVCLGKEMAFIQMKYVVASVLRRFVIKPVCLDQPVFVPLLTGHMAGGLKVRVLKRV